MEIEVPYKDGTKSFEVDDERLLWTISPNNPPAKGVDAVKEALNHPIGTDSLEKLVQGAENVVLLVDDGTRSTPQREILPVVLDRLNEIGMNDDDIKVIVGLGTHRKMAQKEMDERFGVTDRVKVMNHECKDRDKLVVVEPESKNPIYVNRDYYEADLSIAIGSIIPHVLTGWTGGSKMVQPGVSGESTTGYTHMMAIRMGVGRSLGEATNPVREEIDRIALKTGLNLILNVVLNLDGEIYGAVAGHPVDAFQEGVKIAKEVYAVEVPEVPDLVVANAHPNERNLWQGLKPLNHSYVLTEGKSDIIFLSPCSEGVSKEHSILIERAGSPLTEIFKDVESGKIEDEVGTAGLLSLETLKMDVNCTFVTEGITKDEAKRMGFAHAETVEEALEEMEGSVGVLTHAGETAPRL